MWPAQGKKPHLLSIWWRIAYWYGFVAQFTVLPFHQARGCLLHALAVACVTCENGKHYEAVMRKYTYCVGTHVQEFSDSGAFSWTDRVVSSLRNNLVFYAVLAERRAPFLLAVACRPHPCICVKTSSCCQADFPRAAQGAGALGLIVLLMSGELKPSYVVGFCIATSNAVGLLGGLFLLGYGLIAIPKQVRLRPSKTACPPVLRKRVAGCSAAPQSVTHASGVPQLWFTASVRSEELALHHRAGLQHVKAVAARQCALPCSPCSPVCHGALPWAASCCMVAEVCMRRTVPAAWGVPRTPQTLPQPVTGL